MAKFVTDIEVYNAALLRVGESPVAQNDTSAEAAIYRGVHDSLVMDLLTRHKWSFARKVHRLIKQGESGNTPRHVYTLPNDFLLAHRLTLCNRIIQDYEIRSGKLLADVDSAELDLHYTFKAAVRDWSADFTEGVVLKEMAVIKRALHDDSYEADKLDKKAEDHFLDALARDRTSQGQGRAEPNSALIRRWLGGSRA